MSTRYEYTPWQSLLPFLRGSFRLPASDVPDDVRRLDLSIVNRIADEPAYEDTVVADDDLALIQEWRPGAQHAQGIPCQLAHSTRTMKVVERNPHTGNVPRSVEVPRPLANDVWVSNNPHPVWRMQVLGSGGYDRAARIIAADGSTTEMIGVTPINPGETHCMGLARYDANGNLHPDDQHVVVGRVQATRLYLNRKETPHRLGIVIRGDDKDPNATAVRQWVALDPATLPVDLTPDAMHVANMLVNHGAYTYDRGGRCSLTGVAGAQWTGVDFGGWQPKMSDFRLVTAGIER